MEEQNRTVQNFVLGFRSLVVRLVPFERGGTKRAKKILAMESGIANFSATMVTSGPLREGRDGKYEGRNEKCEFLARKSASSSPIVRIFGKGKCKFIANFSATMVTSLPSFSLSLSHRKYLTHNIGSASALPIINRGVVDQPFSHLHVYFSAKMKKAKGCMGLGVRSHMHTVLVTNTSHVKT